MFFNINLFIVYLFSFLFNKLYFNIFKIFKSYIFIVPKLYSTYSINKKVYYIGFASLLCILVFCKIFLFIYFYLLFFFKFLAKVYINIKKNIKNNNKTILNWVYWVYWFNLLIHLKVLSRKFQNGVYEDITYFSLKWNCYYYYFYIIYVFKDVICIIKWFIQQIIEFQWYILYIQIIYYLKLKKLKCIYYIKLFIKGFLVIYCFSGIRTYIKKFKKPIKWNIFIKKKKKASFISKVKFTYHRSNRLIKEKFYNKVKKPINTLSYFMSNFVESVFFILFKTGANSIVYYFYKIIKYSYSISLYIWHSDIIYRFFKLIERKKW
jgi:hypothetical protein